jgi:arylsulfatase
MPWDQVPEAEKDRFDHLMAVYAAVVHRMDRAIGDLVAGLRERGVLDDTLILFLSDNGGNAEAGPAGRTEGDPTRADSNWFCGESWAFPQNTPFRLYKHYNHEGGIATPLIAHWPAGLGGTPGRLDHSPGHLIDIMATCVDVAGAAYPAEQDGRPIQPMEGVSLRPRLTAPEGPAPAPRTLYWEHEGNAAVRVGDLKLVRRGREGPWELYDLKADRTERNDLAAARPDTVAEMSALWEAWAERAQVKPYPAPEAGNPKKGKAKKGKAQGKTKAA